MSLLSNKSLKWIVAGVVAVGSVSAIGLTAASAKSPAAGPQVATLAEPAHAVPAKAKVKAAKHKTATRTVKHTPKKHAARKTARHVNHTKHTKHTKHTAAKGKHKPAAKSHKTNATR
jgi:hypothetical protein